MQTIFITATGTEVGKTFVAVTLIHQLRSKEFKVRAIKPVISGFCMEAAQNSDTGELLRALDREVTAEAIDDLSPWRFTAPLSPDLAAAREGRTIPFESLVGFCREAADQDDGLLLVEGVGGVMVPLDDRHTVVDWIARLSAPVLLVAGSYLGTLSHTLTAVAVLKERRIPVLGIVISESEQSPTSGEETAATLSRFLPDIPVRVLPRADAVSNEPLPDLTHLIGSS